METPFHTCVTSDDEVACDQVVYFGADLSIGDIGEVRGKVLSCEKSDADGGYTVSIEVLALDDRFPSILEKTLRGEAQALTDGNGTLQWAVGLKQTNGLYATLVTLRPGSLRPLNWKKLLNYPRRERGW